MGNRFAVFHAHRCDEHWVPGNLKALGHLGIGLSVVVQVPFGSSILFGGGQSGYAKLASAETLSPAAAPSPAGFEHFWGQVSRKLSAQEYLTSASHTRHVPTL